MFSNHAKAGWLHPENFLYLHQKSSIELQRIRLEHSTDGSKPFANQSTHEESTERFKFNLAAFKAAKVGGGERIVAVVMKPPEKRTNADLQLLEVMMKALPGYSSYSQLRKQELGRKVEYSKFWSATTILKQGHVASNFYFILTGQVEIYVQLEKTNSLVSVLEAGQTFGELALMGGPNVRRHATVITSKDTELLWISREDFEDVLKSEAIQTMKERFQYIARIPFFARLGREAVNHLAFTSQLIEVPANSHILSEGGVPPFVYLFCEGKCSLSKCIQFTKVKTSSFNDRFNLHPHPPTPDSKINTHHGMNIVTNLVHVGYIEGGYYGAAAALASVGTPAQVALIQTVMDTSDLRSKFSITSASRKSINLTDHLRAAESRISNLQTALEKCGSRSSTPSSNVIYQQQHPLSNTASEDAKQLRALKKQLKQTHAQKTELELQVHRMNEDLLALQNIQTATTKSIQTVNASASRGSTLEKQSQPPDIMISLVRELSSSNAKLTLEANELKDLLAASEVEILALRSTVEELEHFGDGGMHSAEMLADTSLAVELGESAEMVQMGNLESEFGDSVISDVTPTSPILKKGFMRQLPSGVDILGEAERWERGGIPHSPTTSNSEKHLEGVGSGAGASRRSSIASSTNLSQSTTQILIRSLHTTALSIHSRLASTDTVSINRRLRRAFDLTELTRLSHSVLTNIETDIQTLSSRFAIHASPTRTPQSEEIVTIVKPMVNLVQMLLREVCDLKRSTNDLSLAYFDVMSNKALDHETRRVPKSRSSSTGSKRDSSQTRPEFGKEEDATMGLGLIQRQLTRMFSNPALVFSKSPGRGTDTPPMPNLSSSPSRVSGFTRGSMVQREASSIRTVDPTSPSSTSSTSIPIQQPRRSQPASQDQEAMDPTIFNPPPDHPFWKSTPNGDLYRMSSSPFLIFAKSATAPPMPNLSSSSSTRDSELSRLPSNPTAPTTPVAKHLSSLPQPDSNQSEEDEIDSQLFNPPQDHPFWKTAAEERGVNELGGLSDPPLDHPYWKTVGSGSSTPTRSRTVSGGLGDIVGAIWPLSGGGAAKE
ncbi:hypothetical protein HDU98_007537 [Podochytrium sp. JEL0797]|nr:hypothetical protein HDU98_007537 [Podochytrium sp. JEL0797]